jgi:hypothetical protein
MRLLRRAAWSIIVTLLSDCFSLWCYTEFQHEQSLHVTLYSYVHYVFNPSVTENQCLGLFRCPHTGNTTDVTILALRFARFEVISVMLIKT